MIIKIGINEIEINHNEGVRQSPRINALVEISNTIRNISYIQLDIKEVAALLEIFQLKDLYSVFSILNYMIRAHRPTGLETLYQEEFDKLKTVFHIEEDILSYFKKKQRMF